MMLNKLDRYVQMMRWDKFSATWLLAWPCFWFSLNMLFYYCDNINSYRSISLASDPGTFPNFKYIALYGIGAIVILP